MSITKKGLAAAGEQPHGPGQRGDSLEHPGADARLLQKRLDNLLRSVRTSQWLARTHLRSAAALLQPGAEGRPDQTGVPAARTGSARDDRRRARKCLGFAGICRRRAARLKESSHSLFG